MTKLEYFRDWLYSFYGDCFNEQEAEVWLPVEKIVIKFDEVFAGDIPEHESHDN